MRINNAKKAFETNSVFEKHFQRFKDIIYRFFILLKPEEWLGDEKFVKFFTQKNHHHLTRFVLLWFASDLQKHGKINFDILKPFIEFIIIWLKEESSEEYFISAFEAIRMSVDESNLIKLLKNDDDALYIIKNFDQWKIQWLCKQKHDENQMYRSDQRPQHSNQQPQRSNQQPQRSNQRPQQSNQQPQQSNQQPQQSNQQPQRSNQRPQQSNQQPQQSNQRPQQSNQQPQQSNQRPQRSNQRPQQSNQQPQQSNQQPQQSNQQPQRSNQLQRSDEDISTWESIKMDESIATFETIGGHWGNFVSDSITQPGKFWHSEKNTGDRGVLVKFRKKTTITSFTFETRNDGEYEKRRGTDYLDVSLEIDGIEVARTPDPFTATRRINMLQPDYRVHQVGLSNFLIKLHLYYDWKAL